MAAGLRIFNDGGISQISDEHQSFALIAKGTVQGSSTNTDPRYDIEYGMPIEVTSSNPVLFAARSSGGATAHLTSIEGNTYKGVVLFGAHGQLTTWYAFSYPKNVPTNLGMQVFNAQGKLMYDAGQKPLRLAHLSVIDTPGMIVVHANQAEFSPSPPPPDIFIPQVRKNRTYASMGVHLFAYRKPEKIYENGKTTLWHGLFYYMPVNDPNGIRLKARWNIFAPATDPYPPGTKTLGLDSLNYSYEKQVSWIIDVTGY